MIKNKVRLGDVTDSCLGKMLDQNKNRGVLQPYLANVNVRWGGFELENLPKMRFLDSEKERYSLKYGDLVVCEGGEPGRCAIWKDELPDMKIQKALHRVRAHADVLDYRYLYYWFLWAGRTGRLAQYYTGATIKHMPGDKLKTVVIDLPDRKTQAHIADILTAYDDLIDNNQKQIRLLEEAAQRIYKEWFIDFHFPGHETACFEDGIPLGWRKGSMEDIASFKRGKTITKDETLEGSVPVIAGGLTPAYYHNQANTAAPVITVSGSGANAGFTRMYHEKVWASDCSFVDIDTTTAFYFVYCFIKANVHQINNLQKGAAQPHVYAKDLNKLEVLIPTENVQDGFTNIVKPFFDKIGILDKQNVCAEDARTRLLRELLG